MRPYIFCHMSITLDGKIIGPSSQAPESKPAGKVFYDLAFGKNAFYQHEGWLSGRTTTDDNFTHYQKPVLDEDAPQVPDGDFVAEASPTMDKYYISIDPSGKLGWQSKTFNYQDTTGEVIEVLTEKASNAYKAFLRKLNISYVIAGKDKLDSELVLKKMADLFQMKTIMLGGGGVLNWSFIQQGLCDELSLVMKPVADGSPDTPSLFQSKEGLSDNTPVSFTLTDIQVKDKENGIAWLRYLVNN
ncbi:MULTISPECIES: dihydrofolate reductase family protein [Leuconostoc]|uniref:RibD family protein n=1 Tax=Leuconostoc gelidum subsp. gelidum TaxID=1607839 RepID=A0ABS7V479_LEUGE|nr:MULTISPECIES: RibD family protein [Leuconostoc]MBS0941859.1 RibD family protein [Leuconostoc mesenteroides]MBS1008176.1 RibD family protein [Leuconostoc suionicum]MBZ5978313.1 RibD family protein [Leuconostoc gelidum subsp. gelidum]MBZ6000180.1 RibD family protein [Leuconostoc gelidum subsp. gelidum]